MIIWRKIAKFHEIWEFWDFGQKLPFRAPIYWNFYKFLALPRNVSVIGLVGWRSLGCGTCVFVCNVWVLFVLGRAFLSVQDNNMACRDVFPSRRLVSSNTTLAPGGSYDQASPVTISMSRGFSSTALDQTIRFQYPPVRTPIKLYSFIIWKPHAPENW